MRIVLVFLFSLSFPLSFFSNNTKTDILYLEKQIKKNPSLSSPIRKLSITYEKLYRPDLALKVIDEHIINVSHKTALYLKKANLLFDCEKYAQSYLFASYLLSLDIGNKSKAILCHLLLKIATIQKNKALCLYYYYKGISYYPYVWLFLEYPKIHTVSNSFYEKVLKYATNPVERKQTLIHYSKFYYKRAVFFKEKKEFKKEKNYLEKILAMPMIESTNLYQQAKARYKKLIG